MKKNIWILLKIKKTEHQYFQFSDLEQDKIMQIHVAPMGSFLFYFRSAVWRMYYLFSFFFFVWIVCLLYISVWWDLFAFALQGSIQSLVRQINCRLLNFSSALVFKVLQYHSKLVKILSECLKAWTWVRCQVTRYLIRIQVVCIWHFCCDWQGKG